jgi:hypothetical protein
MNYPRELLVWPIGKAGFTMRIQILVNLPAIVGVMQLVLKPEKLVKNVNAIIKALTSSYKKQNHLLRIKIRNPDYLEFYLDDEL